MRRLPGGFFQNSQPGTLFCYHLKKTGVGNATLTITDKSRKRVYRTLSGRAEAGLNVVPWLENSSGIPTREPGEYHVVLSIDGKEYVRTLIVVDASDEDCHKQTDALAPPRG
jgi:hypothetical protein